MKDIYDLSLKDITPPNIAQDKKVSALIAAIDPQLQPVTKDISNTLILARIDELDEQTLDLLAWQLHVDFYDLAYDIEVKRKAIKSSIIWHMHKGTVGAIMQALNLIDIQAQFTNWDEFGGEPYTFMISAVVAGPFYRTRGKDMLATSIRRAVNESKAARSLMAKLDISIKPRESVGIYGAVLKAETFDINLGIEDDLMHELLIVFEKRIIDKLSSYANIFLDKMKEYEQSLNQRISDFEKSTHTRLNEFEQRTNSRLDDFEENTRLRLSDFERTTLNRLNAFEQNTSEHMREYEDRIDSRLYVYQSDMNRKIDETYSQLILEMHDLRDALVWKEDDK